MQIAISLPRRFIHVYNSRFKNYKSVNPIILLKDVNAIAYK